MSRTTSITNVPFLALTADHDYGLTSLHLSNHNSNRKTMATPSAIKTIQNSYLPRQTPFILDEESPELGQKNSSDEDYNRIKITQREIGRASCRKEC